MDYEEVKNQLLANPKVREEYEDPPLSAVMAQLVVERRKKLSMTQKQLADKMATSQSQVWRIESGHFNPTAKTLTKLERALHFSFGDHFRHLLRVPQGPPRKQLEEWRDSGKLVISDEDFEHLLELEEDAPGQLRQQVEKIENIEWGEKEEEEIRVTIKIEKVEEKAKQGAKRSSNLA